MTYPINYMTYRIHTYQLQARFEEIRTAHEGEMDRVSDSLSKERARAEALGASHRQEIQQMQQDVAERIPKISAGE